jgi:ABC-type phosphate/phosphonate transport system substrate-binding protein
LFNGRSEVYFLGKRVLIQGCILEGVEAINHSIGLPKRRKASLIIVVVLLTACGRNTPSEALEAASAPSPLPADLEEGPAVSEEIIVQFLLVAEEPTRATVLAEEFNEDEEVAVTLDFTDSYAAALSALCTSQAQVVSLDAFGYLTARTRGCGEALYVLEIDGATTTQGQILADSWTGVYALEGARGRTFCRPDGLSLHGWVIPSITLRARGINPFTDLGNIIDTEDDETTIRMLHDGECAVAATLLGAEQEIVEDLDNPARITFVEELIPVPNDVVVISTQLDEQTHAVLLDLLRQQRGELAETLDADSLTGVSEEAFDSLEALLADAGIDPVAMSQ